MENAVRSSIDEDWGVAMSLANLRTSLGPDEYEPPSPPLALLGGAQSILAPLRARAAYWPQVLGVALYAALLGAVALNRMTPAPAPAEDALELVMLPPPAPPAEEPPPVEEPPPPVAEEPPPPVEEPPPPPVAEEPAVAPVEPKPIPKPKPPQAKPKVVEHKPVARPRCDAPRRGATAARAAAKRGAVGLFQSGCEPRRPCRAKPPGEGARPGRLPHRHFAFGIGRLREHIVLWPSRTRRRGAARGRRSVPLIRRIAPRRRIRRHPVSVRRSTCIPPTHHQRFREQGDFQHGRSH